MEGEVIEMEERKRSQWEGERDINLARQVCLQPRDQRSSKDSKGCKTLRLQAVALCMKAVRHMIQWPPVPKVT